ncbi:unnamed protein product [Arabidopsis halleri]
MCVINPATRWYRKLPEARFQALVRHDFTKYYPLPLLGFGKDNVTRIYKLVWLYKSHCLDLGGQTNTCELTPMDRSIETQVLSLDLHTETFTVLAKIPVAYSPHHRITMCTLNDRLCLSEDAGDT